jgi:hypothetical protein
MPNLFGPALTFPTVSFPGQSTANPSGIVGEQLYSLLSPVYSTLAKAGKLHYGYALLTAPVIFSTAAATGGPLVQNPTTSGVDVHILAVSALTVVASAVAGGVGFTGGPGTVSSTTAIDSSGNTMSGGPNSAVNVFRVGTPAAAGLSFMPILQVDTGALTVSNMTPAFTILDGAFVIPPGTWGSIAASATLTTLQLSVGLLWAELPH